MRSALVVSVVLLLANRSTARSDVFERCPLPNVQTSTGDAPNAIPPLLSGAPTEEDVKNSTIKYCIRRAQKGGITNYQCWYNEKDDSGCCMSFFISDTPEVFSILNGMQPDGDFVGGPLTDGVAPECGPVKPGSWSKCLVKSCANNQDTTASKTCEEKKVTICRDDSLFIVGGSCGGDGKCEGEPGEASAPKEVASTAVGEGDKKTDSSAEAKKGDENDKSAEKSTEPTSPGSSADDTKDTGSSATNDGDAKQDDDSGTCFPDDAVVELESGTEKRMDQLAIGDRVKVGKAEYSEVFMFTHKLETTESFKFVRLLLSSGETLEVTPGHYVYANSELISAGTVSIGDTMRLSNGALSIVTGRDVVYKTGLFNPQTLKGDICVNGIIVSTYTRVVDPTYAHKLLQPLRFAYSWMGWTTSALEGGGGSTSLWGLQGDAREI